MSTQAATVLLLIAGRLMGPGLPAEGQPIVTAQTVPVEVCQQMTFVQGLAIRTGKGETFLTTTVECGHARDWARLVEEHDCRSTAVNTGDIKIVRCEK